MATTGGPAIASARAKHERKRTIEMTHTDFNSWVRTVLPTKVIPEREAIFCLIDQRTFECHWQTLVSLAGYRAHPYKIELLYFFANAWLGRALADQRDDKVLRRWWGREDWEILQRLESWDRSLLMKQRFEQELGYRFVRGWPIYDKGSGGRIMYFLIHATDHEDAPMLMARAYDYATQPKESPEQLLLALGRPPLRRTLTAQTSLTDPDSTSLL